jgi:hypothetical protein
MVLTIDSTTIKCESSGYVYATDLQSKLASSPPTNDKPGSFYIDKAVSVTSTSNVLSNCYLCDEGAGYTLISTVFSDTSSTYDSNAALKGGLFSLQDTTFELDSVTISNT